MQKQEFLYKAPNHAANLNNMRLEEKWCDVTIKVNGREIRAHKVILAANLRYFATMLSNESFQESKEGVINMESVEETDLEAFVSYAYTGEILLTEGNALNLLELANYLSEDGIKKACVEFLEKHVKVEEACRAYKFSNTIGCLSLNNAAKAKIIANLGNCSTSAEYLNFDSGSLMGILSDGKTQSIQLQILLFEGIIRWIKHDAKHRKMCMEDLLSSINISKLKAGDVTSCLFQNLAHCNDEHGITKDALFYYEANKVVRKESEQVFLVGGPDSFQFYNFIEKKWSLQLKTPGDGRVSCQCSAVLNNKLYYISSRPGKCHIYIFDPSSKQITTLPDPSSRILGNASLCTCSRFLYICGGTRNDSPTNQFVRYDPQTNSFETLTPMRTSRWSAASIFYQGCLHVLGGHGDLFGLSSVEKYDSVRNEWTTLASMCEGRRGHAVAELDGKLYVCGGFLNMAYKSSVEVYDPTTNRWQLVASMNKARSYFVVVVHKDRLLAIGGAEEETVESYDPTKDQWQMVEEMSSGLEIQCRAGGLILSSCITNTQ